MLHFLHKIGNPALEQALMEF